MAEEYVMNESFVNTEIASTDELTPLVSDGDLRARIASTANMLGWEKIGSDDDIDQGVSYFVCCEGKITNIFIGPVQTLRYRSKESIQIFLPF